MISADYFVAEILRSSWIPGLHKVQTSEGGLDQWLGKGQYSWVDAGAGSVTLDVSVRYEPLAVAFASEISRFACATYESLLDTDAAPHGAGALGWALVRFYYASFYAAHALLRIGGLSLTMISPKTAHIMNKVGGQFLPISPNVASGLYAIAHDIVNKRLVLTKVGGGKGGSHEDMWERFLSLLRLLENDIIFRFGRIEDAQVAVEALKILGNNLCRDGKKNGAWLSTVRNGLNYRQEYGVWFPCTLTAASAKTLSNRMMEWKPLSKASISAKPHNDLMTFVDSCNATTQLLTSSLMEIAKRAPNLPSSFVSRGALRLLRSRKVAT